MNIRWVDDLSQDEAAVRALLQAAGGVDGWPQLPPGAPLPSELAKGPYLLGQDDGLLVAVGQLNEAGDAFGRQVAELIVHPGHRGRGHGGAMLDHILARAATTLRVWSHTDHPAAAALARRHGFARVRELLRMGMPLSEDLPSVQLPEGVTLRTFRPGIDERPLVEVNARAFSWHPEQSQLSVADVAAAEREEWFDPEGLFVVERDQRLVGFHWTKVHPAADGEDPVGEVYVVGVDPDAHGGGLGRNLTIAGLHYLRKRGLKRVILYVEGDNAPALAVYRKLGFTVESTAVQYERTVTT
ncbi:MULTISPECIES: mycothiol synthase [Thermocrispum]|uniref:Mycothiol acetyltransferase n=1 Tax=Thermocrispum agreste TaxID=37925 RepID=A0A2W4L4Z3_9PSEU|nr:MULTISPECIES: mycothiol synthase [Thermocrispum]PZM90676.1 MAG: mycothiol synthase [Thermocrispum agreste]